MSLPAPVPVKVNFNVVIDADSKVTLFGEPVPVPTNVIVAEHMLPVTALYDADAGKGLLEIWEPADAQGDIKCQLANSDTSTSGGPVLTGAYQVAAKRLAAGLEAILCDRFDCSGAAPYTNYTANVEYYKQRDFGRVALGMVAHYLFGHVDATAAITNDKAFVESMLSVSAAGDDETEEGAAARAAAFTKSTAANVEAWNYAASAADANLALRLVKAIVEKGKAGADIASASLVQSAVSAVTDSSTDQTLANIVKQVIGQDSSRVQNVDGSARTREQHLLLRFYPGDVIYMNIKVKKPTVEVTGYAGGANAPANSLVTEQSYALKITLSSGLLPAYTPAALSGMGLWLDAADPDSVTLSGSAITTWADKSGAGNNAAPAVGGSGVVTYSSASKGVVYNGTASLFTNHSCILPSESAFLVVSLADVNAGQPILGCQQDSGRDLVFNGGRFYYGLSGVDPKQMSQPVSISANTKFLIEYTNAERTIVTQRLNGTVIASGGVIQPTTNQTKTRIGGYLWGAMNGTIHEVIMFNRQVTPIEREKIEGYMAHKWKIAASLPATHPYKAMAPVIGGSTPVLAVAPSASATFETTFNTGNDVGLSGYDAAGLKTNTPAGSGYSYQPSASQRLYKSLGLSNLTEATFCISVYKTGNPPDMYVQLLGNNANGTGVGIANSVLSVGWAYTSVAPLDYLIPQNTWVHIAVTVTPTVTKLYINGQLYNTVYASLSPANLGSLLIGADNSYDTSYQTRYFVGQLDNPRLYTSALTDGEVLHVYNASRLA